jgi:hypothetical protein
MESKPVPQGDRPGTDGLKHGMTFEGMAITITRLLLGLHEELHVPESSTLLNRNKQHQTVDSRVHVKKYNTICLFLWHPTHTCGSLLT